MTDHILSVFQAASRVWQGDAETAWAKNYKHLESKAVCSQFQRKKYCFMLQKESGRSGENEMYQARLYPGKESKQALLACGLYRQTIL